MLLAASMPLSKFGMSLAQFIIGGGWLLGGNLKIRILRTFRQPVVWALWSVYLLHVAGIFYTSDLSHGLADLRIKIPLLTLPLFFSSIQPLTGRQYRIVLRVLITATVISTLISLGYYLGILKAELHDIRDISRFMSHIRLALLVCFSIAGCVWFIRKKIPVQQKILFALSIAWLTYFLVLLESLTGLVILIAGSLIFFIRQLIIRPQPVYRIAAVLLVAASIAGALKLYDYIFIDSIRTVHTDASLLPKNTARGNEYKTYPDRYDLENGRLVWESVSELEVDTAWRQRSQFTIWENGYTGQMIELTLLRYLTAKNYPKDASGVARLTDREVALIERGIANPGDEELSSMKARMRNLAWEYRNYYYTGDPSGHSFTQRIEYWKTSVHIIKQHPLFGVGTGDVNNAFTQAYKEMNSKLDPRWQLMSHNQYLRVGVTLGIVGMLIFLFSLSFPWFYHHKSGDLLYSAFFFIAICSMFTEDTLETQAGVTFFAFLNSFFLFNDARVASMPDALHDAKR